MEAIFQSYTLPYNPLAISRKLLAKTYENFSKLLKTFYENFLRKLLKTSNPTLFQSSRNLTKTSCENFQFPPLLVTKTPLANFRFLHFWLRKLGTSNPLANF